MICIIIISLLLLIHDTVVAEQQHHDDIQEILLEEKSGNFNTDTSVFRKMLKTYNVTTVKSGLDDVERRSAPYVFRWSDGRRETGDRLSTTPWDDYDFNGAKDYEYQLSFRGCRINYIQVRLLIVIISPFYFEIYFNLLQRSEKTLL